MENLKISVDGNTLTMTVDLSVEGRPSKTGYSDVIASSNGNVRLFDPSTGLYREETLNVNVSRRVPKDRR